MKIFYKELNDKKTIESEMFNPEELINKSNIETSIIKDEIITETKKQ